MSDEKEKPIKHRKGRDWWELIAALAFLIIIAIAYSQDPGRFSGLYGIGAFIMAMVAVNAIFKVLTRKPEEKPTDKP